MISPKKVGPGHLSSEQWPAIFDPKMKLDDAAGPSNIPISQPPCLAKQIPNSILFEEEFKTVSSKAVPVSHA